MKMLARLMLGLIGLLFFLPSSFAVLPGVTETTITKSVDRLTETRCCSVPERAADGRILRSTNVLNYFKQAHPCPANGLTTGSCPGWVMDHVIPLACGGVDAVFNIQWLPTDAWKAKSLWERKIYGGHGMSPGCP